MAYWRLFFHVVWTTKGRQPLVAAEREDALFRAIAKKCHDLHAQAFAINGMPDHVHVVAAVPPAVALPDFVKHLKGASSRFAHLEFGSPFEWQAGYGIFSISERNLKVAIEYVQRQKQHHAAETTIARLERTSENDEGPRLIYPLAYPEP